MFYINSKFVLLMYYLFITVSFKIILNQWKTFIILIL